MDDAAYPLTLEWQEGDREFLVTCPDLEEVATAGRDEAEAIEQGTDAVRTVLAWRTERGEDIPAPSPPKGRPVVRLDAGFVAKIAVYRAWRESGLSKVALAAELGMEEKGVRRLLDPDVPTKLPTIEAALKVLGKRLIVIMQAA